MAKEHGIFIYEEATALTIPKESSAGLQVVIGTAPVNMLENPDAAVNTPILALSSTEAQANLGYSMNFKEFMLLLSWIVTNLLSYAVTNLSDKSACICQKYIFNRLIALFMRIPHGCQGRQRRLYSLDSHAEYAYTLAAIDKLESK